MTIAHPAHQFHRRRRRAHRGLAAAIAAAALPLTLGLASPAPAEAATTPLIHKGDILTASLGNIFEGSTIDKIDPITGARSRIATGGRIHFPDTLVSDLAGNLYVGGSDMGLVRIDHATGEQRQMAFEGQVEPSDMTLGPDGNLIIADRGFAGTQIVALNPTDGSRGVIPSGTTFSNDVQGLAVEFDGSILVLDRGRGELLRIPVGTAKSEIVTSFAQTENPTGMTIAKDSSIRVHVGLPDNRGKLVGVDRRTGAQKVLASGADLGDASTGMARAADGSILDAQSGADRAQMLRISATGGAHTELASTPSGEMYDVTVAGVDQIPATPSLVARSDSYAMERPSTELHVTADQGPLRNDTDPAYNMSLKGELVTQPSHGFVSFLSTGTGEFFYFPNAGFTGADSFTYRVRTPDGRLSAPGTVRLDVKPDQRPVAKPDFFNAAAGRTTTIGEGGVLFNDTDPQGDPLIAKLVNGAAHGLAFVDSDGTVTYTPATGFTGEDTFTYTARDPQGHTSQPTQATITVNAPSTNNTPTVGATKGGTLGSDGLSGTFKLGVFDFETAADKLKLTATSSNTALVPNANLTLGGAGSGRTLGIKAASGKAGTAIVTVKVTDGAGVSGSFAIVVKAGSGADETLSGTADTDLLLGLGGNDTLLGNAGYDLLAGGGGNDTMTGGAGVDSFRGNAGTNTVTDGDLAIGETIVEAANRA